MSVVFLSLLLIFRVNSAGCSGDFHVVFKFCKFLKSNLEHFEGKNCTSLDLWAVFSRKPCNVFIIAQCKQPRLVKPFLNSDLCFTSLISGTALLETIVSYKPLHRLSQENRKTLPPALLDRSAT